MADEAVMERYLEGNPPSPEELSRLLVQAIAEGSLVPIVCVSARARPAWGLRSCWTPW